MTIYEELIQQAADSGAEVIEHRFESENLKGLYCDGVVAVSDRLSNTEKACVTAEEIGHHLTAAGDILDQRDVVSRKQELRGRAWAYDRLIGLSGIVRAYQRGCRNRFEVADYLGVTEELLQAALKRYKEKYGPYTRIDEEHLLYFEPLGIMEMM